MVTVRAAGRRSFPSIRVRLALAAAALLAALALATAFTKPGALPLDKVPVAVDAVPVKTFAFNDERRRFGALEFRGGLVLSSTFAGFGGISGFALDADGARFLAVTDAGLFLEGRLVLDGDRPLGMADVSAVAIRDDKGGPIARAGGDAESLTVARDAVFVGFEGRNEIWRYPRPPLGATGTRVDAPAIGGLGGNKGLETLVFVPSGALKGALVGIAETGAARADVLDGFIIGGPRPGTFSVRRHDAFSATDAALTLDGDVILLERHYTRSTGVKMRLRRFPLDAVKPGAVIGGEVLGTFDMGYQIDNMEGLAVTRNAAGETLLTIISDDNFNPLQRTVLLRFALLAD
jgi:hypothetical protein